MKFTCSCMVPAKLSTFILGSDRRFLFTSAAVGPMYATCAVVLTGVLPIEHTSLTVGMLWMLLLVIPPVILGYANAGFVASWAIIYPYTIAYLYLESQRMFWATNPQLSDVILPAIGFSIVFAMSGFSLGRGLAMFGIKEGQLGHANRP